jgi:hypothetical protein
MNSKRIFQVISIVTLLVLIAVTVDIRGNFNGFRKGMSAQLPVEETTESPKFSAATHGPNFFDLTSEKYLLIIAAFFGCLILELFSDKSPIQFLQILGLAFATFPLGQLLTYKFDIGESTGLMYRGLLQRSIWIDEIMLAAIILLMLRQAILIRRWWLDERSNNERTLSY